MTDTSTIMNLARELALPEPVLEPLEHAAKSLPELPLDEMASPRTAGKAWKTVTSRIPDWREDDGMSQLAAALAAACRAREVYREHQIEDSIFLDTMGCFRRFLLETHDLLGRWAYDRGFWTWRQTGCLLFRLGALEFEYCPEKPGEILPDSLPENVVLLSVHIPSDTALRCEELDRSYAWASRFFAKESNPLHYRGAPSLAICCSWLLAPALDELLPETSGIRQFSRDYTRYAVNENDTEFYRWLYQSDVPLPAEDLPERTSLQRAVKARLLSGGKFGMGCGTLNRKI